MSETRHEEDQPERFRAYLDDELSPDERAAFEAQRRASPELDAEFRQYRKMLELLSELPEEPEPGRFAERVEGRIRRRSRGTFFALEPRVRLPYEAVAIIILLGAVVLLFLHAAPPREMPVMTERGGAARTTSPLEQAAAALARFGPVEQAGTTLIVRVAPEDDPAFRQTLRRVPGLEIVQTVPDEATGWKTYTLRERVGP